MYYEVVLKDDERKAGESSKIKRTLEILWTSYISTSTGKIGVMQPRQEQKLTKLFKLAYHIGL